MRAEDVESEDALPGEDRDPADEEPQDEAADEGDEEPPSEESQPVDDEDESLDRGSPDGEDEPQDAEDEPADERDAPRRRTSGRRHRDGGMSAAQAARSGLRGLADLIGKRPEGVTAVEPTDDGWRVGVEVVEERRVPSTADILAIYQAELDADGRLLSYRRIRRYSRGRGDDGGER
jgi:hypothetical protein